MAMKYYEEKEIKLLKVIKRGALLSKVLSDEKFLFLISQGWIGMGMNR